MVVKIGLVGETCNWLVDEGVHSPPGA